MPGHPVSSRNALCSRTDAVFIMHAGSRATQLPNHSIRQRQHAIVRTITAAAHREDRQLAGSEDGVEQAFQVAAEKRAAGMAVFCAQRAVADMQLATILVDVDQGAQRGCADLFERVIKVQLAGLRMFLLEDPAANALA